MQQLQHLVDSMTMGPIAPAAVATGGAGALSVLGAPTTPSTTSGGAPLAVGATRWQPGTLNVGINMEGLDEIAGTGATPDFVRSFDTFDQAGVSAREKQLVAQGSTLFKSLKPMSRSTGAPIPWASVASGAHDAYLTNYLMSMKRDGGKNVLFSFNHEADQKGNANKGTPAEFVAAWKHVHDLADKLGVSTKAGGNVEFVWTMVGYGFETGRVGAYYPGDAYVDYVGTDPYDVSKSGERKSFANAVMPTMNWMDANGVNKPVIVAETGSNGAAGYGQTSQAQWVTQMMQDLRTNAALTRIVGVSYWSNQSADGSLRTDFKLDAEAARTYASYM